MATPMNARPDSTGVYVIREHNNPKDLERLYRYDQTLTTGMGGVLSEQPTPTELRRVLDIGCGAGAWLIEVAKTYPPLSQLTGIDRNERMIEYACAQAAAQRVDDRVQFCTMDALRVLEFPPDSFDLANQRMGGAYLRTWDWLPFLSELRRVTRAGGVVRIVEAMLMESTSPTLNYFKDLLIQALYQSGHLFALDSNGLVPGVIRIMQQLGLQDVQTCEYTLHNLAGTPESEYYNENIQYIFSSFQPFFRKWINPADDFDMLKQRAQDEMRQPGFTTSWKLTTIWATNRK